MRSNLPRFTWGLFLLAFGLLSTLSTAAHSPFDSSTRLIVNDSSLEFRLVVGMEGGAALLHDAPSGAFQNRPDGPAFQLPLEYTSRLFFISNASTAIAPSRVDVRTDGLEFDFTIEYPQPAGNVLVVDAAFVNILPAAYKLAFVMTDEMGNILAARVLTREAHVFELALPISTVVAPENPPTTFAMNPSSIDLPSPPSVFSAPAPPVNLVLGFSDFLRLGIKHILTGYDHLLFLCGLLVVCRKVGPMLAIITCFTLAHSVTLALAALDLVQISSRLTEPLIAATIVFVGIENFRGVADTKTRCGFAFGFGLIHGFGFATALRETGLSGTGLALLKPLLAFNLGVECGQLAVAALFLPALFALRKVPWFDRHGTRLISAAVVLLGGYWLLERMFGF
jgi:hypothetical protein